VSESAASAKPLLLYGLARNRRSPKRASEPAAKRASTRKRAQWKEDAKLPTKKKPLETFRSSPEVQFYGSRGGKCRK